MLAEHTYTHTILVYVQCFKLKLLGVDDQGSAHIPSIFAVDCCCSSSVLGKC